MLRKGVFEITGFGFRPNFGNVLSSSVFSLPQTYGGCGLDWSMGNWLSPVPDDISMDSPEGQLVQNILHDKIVVVFSKTSCPYCKMAKDALDQHDANYTVVELDKRDDGRRIQGVLGKMTGATTVPRVFIKGKFIGGGTEIKNLNDEGKLEVMLRECGAI